MSRLTDINKCIVNYKQSYTDEEISDIIVKLGKLEDLEEQLGINLLELKPVESASIDCSAYLVNGVWKKKISICGDDYYGSYPLDEYRKLVLKDIICGSLYAMQKLKEIMNDEW